MMNAVVLIVLMFGICGCKDGDDNPEPAITITNNLLSFSATNLSDENKTKVNSIDEKIMCRTQTFNQFGFYEK